MNRSVHAFLLVFALLFAQAGAAAHTAGHAVGHGGDKGLPADAACELCVGYGQLSGAAPLPEQPRLPLSTARQPLPDTAATVVFTQTVFHAPARAPPLFS